MTTQWLALILQTTITLGAIVGVYARIMARLTTIEVSRAERDRNAATREELYERRAKAALEDWCKSSCPRAASGGSNPRIQQYGGEPPT